MATKQTWQLRWMTDDNTGVIPMGPGSHILGSARDADLRLSHPTVSRYHARLTCDDDGVTIEDLGSTNGSMLDGTSLDAAAVITEKAHLKVGRVKIDVVPVIQHHHEDTSPPSDFSSGASMLLGPKTVGFLRDIGEDIAFQAGEVVIRRGEQQEFFYVVIEGEVELVLIEGESRRRPLARLGEGGIFGAESALGKSGAAVDAFAVTDVRLLRYPASALPTALQESASLRRKMLGGIARNLHDATSDALDLLRGTEVIARLVQGDSDPDALIAASALMRKVERKIAECAEQNTPVVIAGEDGTGKTQIARLIHDASARSSGQLIAVNCRELNPGHATELILGEDLGGSLPTGGHASGGIHLAHNGTLVLRGADALDPAAQQLLAAYLARSRNRSPNAYPDTRIIVTARAAETGSDTHGVLAPDLVSCFNDVIKIPPLVKRPKDIIPLAEEFLKRQGPEPPLITEDARQALLSLRYQRRNVAELREVVELAVRIADGPEIRAEHIFGGVGEDAAPPGVDVTDTPLVKGLLRRTSMPLLRAGALVGFAAVIVLCLAFSTTVAGRLANTAIWSLWEPAVFALFFLAGPVWCTLCPLSTAARIVKKAGHRDRPPPAWIIRHGPWLAIVGFAIIVWVERVFDSLANPVASGLLLVGLVTAAVGFGLAYRREVWCRYLCPLGRLATTLAPAAPLQLTAKQRVCASSCTTHACYKGTPEIAGCTVFHHPLEGKQSYRCKLCLDCLQSCPHHSANLQVRPPLMAVWRLDSSAKDLSMFALTVTLYALALVAARSFEVLSHPLHFTVLTILVLISGIALHHMIMAFAATDRRMAIMIRLGIALMILGWAALMTSQLANVTLLDQARVTLIPPPWLPEWSAVDFSLLTALQILTVAVGLTLALVSLGQVNFRGTSFWTRFGRRIAPLIFAGYAVAVITLLLT